MASVVRRTFSDPNGYEQAIRGAHASDFTVFERGAFDATLTTINLNQVWLQRGSDNLARCLHVSVDNARRSILFLEDRQARPVTQSGNEFSGNDVVSFGQATTHFQRTFGPIHWAAMSLPSGCLEEAARAIAGKDIGKPSTSLWTRPSAAHLAQLRQLHQAVDRMTCSGEPTLDHPEAMRALEHSITVAIIRCLAARTDDKRAYGWYRHQKIMWLFKDWLDANAGRAVYLQEVCTALNVSAPTLRRCCEEHLGMSPMQYLWLRRMNLARRELLQADSSMSVTATAMNFGFWHLGRFAAEYQSLFGEPPRATLAHPPLGE